MQNVRIPSHPKSEKYFFMTVVNKQTNKSLKSTGWALICSKIVTRAIHDLFPSHCYLTKFPGTLDAAFSSSQRLVAQSCLDSLQAQGLWPARLLSPWNSPGKNTRVGCHFLLQGIFSTQGSNLGFLKCRQILYHLSHQGSPKLLEKMIHRAETSVSDSTSRGH